VHRQAFAHEATIRLEESADPAAVGAAVTVALCGHWDHDGPCRWPHNNAIQVDGDTAAFRTVFVASAADEDEVRAQIDGALRCEGEWHVLRSAPRAVAPDEAKLAACLARTPVR
jgi:hypothetical protein